jgi:hypothetical protein
MGKKPSGNDMSRSYRGTIQPPEAVELRNNTFLASPQNARERDADQSRLDHPKVVRGSICSPERESMSLKNQR